LTTGPLRDEAVLGMLRHIIQYRLPFKVLLAGSHTLDEFQRWAGYLINAQVIHLSFLREAEARQLVEQPIKDFTLSYEAEASRRVLDLTAGHPFLVQLLCSEIVRLKNEQQANHRYRATLADIDLAVPRMLKSGSQFFADIQRNQIDAGGLKVLRFLAQQGEGQGCHLEELSDQIPDRAQLESSLNLLVRRELITASQGVYRFQVEAIRRWFLQ
jgi:hypothetical protein